MKHALLALSAICLCAIASFIYFKTEEVVAKSDEEFPYPLFEVNGKFALAKWTELSLEPGTPVIISSLEELNNIRDTFEFSADQSVEDVLDKAAKLTHPTSLFDHINAEHRAFISSLQSQDNSADIAAEMAALDPLKIADTLWGEWPKNYTSPDRLLSLDDWKTGKPLETIYITVLPTERPWEAPAYLKFGGWNANPPAEVHVAALKQWNKDFGAVPIVIQSDLIELRVGKKPSDQDAAQYIAEQQYLYSPDIVDQGVGTLNNLAAILE